MEYLNFKKIVRFSAASGEAIEEFLIAESGLKKAYALVGLFDDVQDVIDIDIKQLKAEFDSIDKAGRDKLIEEFKKDFDLENDVIEMLIEESIDAVMKFVDFVDTSIEIFKKYKDRGESDG